MLEPHRIERELGDTGALTLRLQTVRYNNRLADVTSIRPRGDHQYRGTAARGRPYQEIIDERVFGGVSCTEKSTHARSTFAAR